MVGFFKKLAVAAALSASAACGSELPSIDVKGNYPGLTAERLSELENKLLQNVENNDRVMLNKKHYYPDMGKDNRGAVFFDDGPKEFLNYFIDFTRKDYESKGMSISSIGDLKLALVPRESIIEECGEDSAACYSSGTIIMPDSLEFISFLSIFNHEFGHHLYGDNAEYPSMSNQMYAPIKTYEFSKPIGSLFLGNSALYPGSENFRERNPKKVMYEKGALFAALNLLDHDGNIEAAMDQVTHTKAMTINTRIQNLMDEYGGANPNAIYFDLWKRILDSYGWEYELSSETGHLSHLDNLEVTSYMELYNLHSYKIINALSEQGITPEVEAIQDEYMQELSNFYDMGIGNPYFRSHIALQLSLSLFDELSKKQIEHAPYSELYALMTEIIRVNEGYPCYIKDPYKCHSQMRDAKEYLTSSYSYVVNSLFTDFYIHDEFLGQQYTKEYIEKFFNGADLAKEVYTPISDAHGSYASNYLPLMALWSGVFWEDDAGNPAYAKKFYKSAIAVNCESDMDKFATAPSYDNCEFFKAMAADALSRFSPDTPSQTPPQTPP